MRVTNQITIPRLAVCLFAALAVADLTGSPASAAVRFTNPNEITLPFSGVASPYPSTINVQGVTGRVTDIAVRLDDVTHYADHLDILLVSPDGATSVVMSDVCETAVVNQDWVFQPSGARPHDHPLRRAPL